MKQEKENLEKKESANNVSAPEENKQVQPKQFKDNRNKTKQQGHHISASSNISQLVIQRVISDGDYNAARTRLIQAGSNTANASHPKHTQGAGSPDGHGVGLLREARDEFRATDAGQENLISGVTAVHHAAIHWAANRMNIDQW